jgi:putative ABC transport system substrate-binding protein
VSRRQLVQGAGALGLGLLAGCGRWPGQASPGKRVYRLGYLGDALPLSFREGLHDLSYFEDQNLLVEYRDPGDRSDRFPPMAAELVALQVDIVVSPGSAGIRAAKDATATIPIVNLGGGRDLVEMGAVATLARPGGNVTGLTSAQDSLIGKRLQLLKEVAPAIRRVAMLWDSNVEGGFRRSLYDEPARELGIEILVVALSGPPRRDWPPSLYSISYLAFTLTWRPCELAA